MMWKWLFSILLSERIEVLIVINVEQIPENFVEIYLKGADIVFEEEAP